MTTADGTVGGTTQLVNNGSAATRFNLVLLSDGYQAADLPLYRDHAQQFVDALRATPPFDAMWGAVNVYRVDVSSTDPGADEPAMCADGGTGSGAMPATYFDSTFCFGGISRLLVADSAIAAPTARAAVPEMTRAIVLVNTARYGGSGGNPVGTYAAAFAPASTALEVAIHEFGHTGFGLADEYEACVTYSGPEHGAPNLTTITDRATTKWAALIAAATPVPTLPVPDCGDCAAPPDNQPPGTVGLFEGGGYHHCGLYRPVYSCKMRDLGSPFCPVCQAEIRRQLGLYAAPEPTTPRRAVAVSAPAINFFFDHDGTITVSDIAPPLTVTGASDGGFLQSRLFPPGEPGTVGAGLFPYEYRVSMTEATSLAGPAGVTRVEIDAGPIVPLDYDGTGPSEVYEITAGGMGNVRIATVEQTARGRLVVTFERSVDGAPPGSPAGSGDTSFFFGFASTRPPRDGTARVTDSTGRFSYPAVRVP